MKTLQERIAYITDRAAPRPITIAQLANFMLGREAKTLGDFAAVRLAIMGGCGGCGASISAGNAYPSKGGYWRCEDCIGDQGFSTVEIAKRAIFGRGLGEQ